MNLASLRRTWDAFNADKAPRLAASIAYSTIFSIAPLIVILVASASAVLGGNAKIEAQLLDYVGRNAGAAAAKAVGDIVATSTAKPHATLIAQIVGWFTFLFGASGFFSSLQDALNAVWGVEATKGGWWWTVRSRLASFLMVLAMGVLLLASFLATDVVTIVTNDFARYVPLAANPALLALAEQVLSFVIVTATFALVYKVLPDVRLAWRDVFFGAFATAILYVVGEWLIALYLALGVATAYGAAGSILVALLWIYYSALIMLLGAEFTKVHARSARLVVPAAIRFVDERPAGADPRIDPPARPSRAGAA